MPAPRRIEAAAAPSRTKASTAGRTALIAAYRALQTADKTVAQLLSLMGECRNKTTLVQALVGARIRFSANRVWNATDLAASVTRLRAANLVVVEKFACNPLVQHDIAVEAGNGPDRAALARWARDNGNYSNWRYGPYRNQGLGEDARRDLRIAIYCGDNALLDELSKMFGPALGGAMGDMFETAIIDPGWLAQRPIGVQELVFSAKIGRLYVGGAEPPDLKAILAHYRGIEDPAFRHLRAGVLRHELETGLIAPGATPPMPDGTTDFFRAGVQATGDFLGGRNDEALAAFATALKEYKKIIGRRKVCLLGLQGLFYAMALLRQQDPGLLPQLEAGLEIAVAEPDHAVVGFQALQALVLLLKGSDGKARETVARLRAARPSAPVSRACVALAEYFVDVKLAEANSRDTQARFEAMREVMPTCARIDAGILARISPDPEPYEEFLRQAPGGGDVIDFAELLQIRAPWERALESLELLVRGGGAGSQPSAGPAAKRLAWLVDLHTQHIDVLEQTAKGAGWTAGRAIALKRLYSRDPKLDYLSDEDRRAIRAIRKETGSYYYHDETYWIDARACLLALVGNPCVFDAAEPSKPIELVAYPAELVVEEKGKAFKIGLSHRAKEPTVFLEAETPTRVRVIDFPASLVELQATLGEKGLTVPREARKRVLEMVKETSPAIPIRADFAAADLPAVAGDPTPIVQLQPHDDGLTMNLMVRPFGRVGPLYVAGVGGHSILAVVGGQQQRATRDLDREKAAASAVLAASPTLQRCGAEGHEWQLEDLESSLELLLELQTCEEPIRIEWPEGKRWRVTPAVDARRMSIKVNRSRNWFQLSGEVQADEGEVIGMQELLERLGDARSRFVPLADGRFLALTRKFQQQLERLRTISEKDGAGRRLHPMGTVAVQDLIDEAGTVKADSQWKSFAERMKAAGSIEPTVPSTLQAELRDYQVEGFSWLTRLAHWGAGACLADDMGLGKTVQAIAAMIEPARHGPCIVLAPTSVCHNWEVELGRFAPTLKVHRLGAVADRAGQIGGLAVGDVLIASYGLLHQEAERLAAVSWQMAVFDEAQALKNADTKRAQASQKLDAKFRVALTGTPIENYLDELWSLFNTINPGLLGSHESFQKRFATPIERERNVEARNALRALIRPFLLRRTKSAVLAELPPRIELVQDVELPDDERAFYEALRRKALESLENLDGTAAGQRKIHILAEITRLRRACCHPGLIDPATELSGAKLEAFLDLAGELIRNRHKALVFSQFVGNLERVRAALVARGIAFQYLDGSTPVRERDRAVAAFQAGEGEVFLISLKAGGVGLNLTAADYVIHLDPWWNPAVEDQASARAHRIGQTRPVTVYRLIVRDSIEEQILALHRDKRDLAADLLEGTETSARLSEDDLIGLIRN